MSWSSSLYWVQMQTRIGVGLWVAFAGCAGADPMSSMGQDDGSEHGAPKGQDSTDASEASGHAEGRESAMDAAAPRAAKQATPEDAGMELVITNGSVPTDEEFDAGRLQEIEFDRTPEPLLLADLWEVLAEEEDPFGDRPANARCLDTGVRAESLGMERVLGIDTADCGYVTARQKTLHDIAKGDIVVVRLWHFELTAAEPAEAHAVVQVDGITFMEERVAIPQEGGLIRAEAQAEREIPAGSVAYFHLHNHGENSWALLEVSSGP